MGCHNYNYDYDYHWNYDYDYLCSYNYDYDYKYGYDYNCNYKYNYIAQKKCVLFTSFLSLSPEEAALEQKLQGYDMNRL